MNSNLRALFIRLSLFAAFISFFYVVRKLISEFVQIPIDLPSYAQLFPKFNAFKILLVVILIFVIYNRELLSRIKVDKVSYYNLVVILPTSLLFYTAYFFTNYLIIKLDIVSIPSLILFTVLGVSLLGIYGYYVLRAFTGLRYLKKVYSATRIQIPVYILIFVLGNIILNSFEDYWFVLSTVIMIFLVPVLSMFYRIDIGYDGNIPWIALSNDFVVRIHKTCSSVDSILLFVIIFAVIFAMDIKNLHIRNTIIAFLLGIIGIFFLNILRILLIIVIGVHYSPNFAVGLFHTNVGWLLFVAYFVLFYGMIRNYIYKSDRDRFIRCKNMNENK